MLPRTLAQPVTGATCSFISDVSNIRSGIFMPSWTMRDSPGPSESVLCFSNGFQVCRIDALLIKAQMINVKAALEIALGDCIRESMGLDVSSRRNTKMAVAVNERAVPWPAFIRIADGDKTPESNNWGRRYPRHSCTSLMETVSRGVAACI